MTRVSFDSQAPTFDERAGLPSLAADQVAAAIVALTEINADERLVEIGAGTGEIGHRLVARVAYVGLDLAASMLSVFRSRYEQRATQAQLLLADADATWPIADASVRVVFGSRCLHLLSLPHVVAETRRVGAPAGVTLVVGSVGRDDMSMRMSMRREMRRVLCAAGIDARSDGDSVMSDLLGTAVAPIEPRVVARWSVATSPADVLKAWANKDGLGGVAVGAETKRDVLARVKARALEEFGTLDRPIVADEEYVLAGVRFSH